MATPFDRMLAGAADALVQPGETRDVTVAPASVLERQDERVGARTAQEIARDVLTAHTSALRSRRPADLIAEKLMLHIDGSGDLQWADIFGGTRVEIPRLVSQFRKTENLLRPIIANAVSQHTTLPLRYLARSLADRRSRQRALVDSVWINHVKDEQDFNSLFADALWLAMAWGFCPVHRYWRDATEHDWYEAETMAGGAGTGALHGMLDCWVGDPSSMVFDRAARMGSVRWASYGRWLPADAVRRQFAHVKGVAGLQGTTRHPSVVEWQRIARKWRLSGLGLHGSPALVERTEGKDEILNVVCRESAPGVEAGWKRGRLTIIAVPGATDLSEGRGSSPLLLTDQPLPGADFSWTNFYSSNRGSDVQGKPWAEDLDQLQVDLNIAKSKRWEHILKLHEAPIVAPGGAITEDMLDVGGYGVMEIEPSLSAWRPRVMEWPQAVLVALNQEIEQIKRALFTIGGYQAVSRGEAPGSRMAYRAILALQHADSTVHAPVNTRFRRSASEFAKGCWRQMKAYGDVGWFVRVLGDEYSHLAEPYVDNTRLSDEPPNYQLVQAFGASPEMIAQEVLELVATRGADGEPFLTTREARRQYPSPLIMDDASDPKAVARRRARTVVTKIEQLAERARMLSGEELVGMADPRVQELAQQVFFEAETEFPRLQDDDLEAHVAALSELTQDETADPVARHAAIFRQKKYYEWQAQMAQQAVPENALGAGEPAQPRGPGGIAPAGRAVARMGGARQRVAREFQAGRREAGVMLQEPEAG